MRFVYSFIILLIALPLHAQYRVRLNKQVSFHKEIPVGNYSGITNIGNGLYALVSDKSEKDGFYIFKLDIDTVMGQVSSIQNMGFKCDSLRCRDAEGITWLPERNTLMIVGEADNRIVEYDLSGHLTGLTVNLDKGIGNSGYESLAYCDATQTIWTCTENVMQKDRESVYVDSAAIIRLQAYDTKLNKIAEYAYRLDPPAYTNRRPKHYAHGVSELLALDNGSLLVLEREFYVPKSIVGAFVICKLYEIFPSDSSRFGAEMMNEAYPVPVKKNKICEWDSKFSLFNRSLANYEGMCLGPKLADGSQTIILVADSQNRHGGVLRDWFRTLVLSQDASLSQ